MVLFMHKFVDQRVVNPTDSRGQQNLPWILASDVTTLVSAGLVVSRILSTSWIAVSAWRYAFILLETEGLTLQQFQSLISWQIHWPSWSKYHLITTLGLVGMTPSIFLAPVLAGAVGWKDHHSITVSKQVSYHNSAARGLAEWNSFLWDTSFFTRKGYVLRAAGFATLAWSNKITKEGTCRHVMALAAQMSPNSTVKNALIPCLEIHDFTWGGPTDAGVERMLENSTDISLLADDPLLYYHPGNSAVFESDKEKGWGAYVRNNGWRNSTLQVSKPPPVRFSGVKKVGIVLERAECEGLSSMFGNQTEMAKLKNQYYTRANCYLYGTVTFTAGIVRAPTATYLSERVVEFDGKPVILPDPWVMTALYLLPDVMARVAGMNVTTLAPWDNIDNYVKALIRQSYMGSWDALNDDYRIEPLELAAQQVVRLLKASVSFLRVYIWFAGQILVLASGLLLGYLQSKVSRPVVIDPAAAALMTDPNRVLESFPRDGLTGLSYVSTDDCKNEQLRLESGVLGDAHHYRLVLSDEDSDRPEKALLRSDN